MEQFTAYLDMLPVQESEEIAAAEKMIYQYEPLQGNLNLWEKNTIELAKFHSMCGNHIFQHLTGQHGIVSHFELLHLKYHIERFPYHNAAAFFQHLIELDLPKTALQFILQHLFPYAVAAHGFVFGTAFSGEHLNCVRPCDMDYITPYFPDPNIPKGVLMSQAQLKSGYDFISEKNRYSRVLADISNQQRYVATWLKDCRAETTSGTERFPKPWSGDLDHSEQMFTDFFKGYCGYCISQFSEGDLLQRKKVEEQLSLVERSARFIFRLERLSQQLESVRKIKDNEQNIVEKQRWLAKLKQELSDPATALEFDAMQTIAPEITPVSLDSIDLYAYVLYHDTFTKTTLKTFPLLDKTSALRRLTVWEEKLYWYRKHPVARTIDLLCRGPRKETLRRILPFYLLDHFLQKEKPMRPFHRKIYHFDPDKLQFHGKFSYCEHPHAVRLQESHHIFYQFLLTWCSEYYPKQWDRKLSNALYTFHRSHLVTAPPTEETHFLHNDFSLLEKGISQALDVNVDMFPQYAPQKINSNEFYHFFYIDTASEVRQCRKDLQKLVTMEIAQQYKQLAFLSKNGFGYSLHPRSWHRSMAEWLHKTISKSQAVVQYVDAEQSKQSLRLAQVELAVQFMCCQLIQEEMTRKVLHYCKTVMSPE